MPSEWSFTSVPWVWLTVKTQNVEKQVAAISGSYTNTLQLQARAEVLKERQMLKYAALDCWKIVAEQLPPGVALQRFSFANGQQLSLNGTATPDQINTLFDFDTGMQKARLNDQAMFDAGDPLVYRQNANQVTWNFSLLLRHVEASP